VLVLALGLVFLVSGTGGTLLGNILALYWLTGAVLALRWARGNRSLPRSRLALVAGVVGIVAAVILLVRSLIRGAVSMDAALAVLGATAIVTGSLRLLGGFRDDHGQVEERSRKLRRFALGMSEIVIGVVWIAVEDLTGTVVDAVGFWALLVGTIMLLDALALRRQVSPKRTAP
jgi:uncharacterized membrane protein HdeD (DUF308 family)